MDIKAPLVQIVGAIASESKQTKELQHSWLLCHSIMASRAYTIIIFLLYHICYMNLKSR